MTTRIIAVSVTSAASIAVLLTTSIPPAEARGGGHEHHSSGFGHGAHFAGDRRHGDDAYIKAASDDRDKLLNTKLKSICRGC